MEHAMLSLCPLTLLPCSPVDVIDAALDAGFDAAGVRLTPVLPTDVDVMADAALRRAIVARLSATGVEVLDIELVRISHETDVAALTPMLQFGGEIGARNLTVTGVAGADWQPGLELETARRLGELCEAAAGFGIRPMIEFMSFRGIATLDDALRMRTLADHPNLGLCVDALHFQRSGGRPGALAAVDPSVFSCLQFCDAPAEAPDDVAKEARYGRRYPGEGGLPLRELVMALPADLPIAVEIPDMTRAGRPIAERAREFARLTRDVLAAAGRAS